MKALFSILGTIAALAALVFLADRGTRAVKRQRLRRYITLKEKEPSWQV